MKGGVHSCPPSCIKEVYLLRYFSRKKTALSIAISNLIIVALAILFWQYDIFNRSSTQSPSDETKALLMDDPKVVVTVNGEPIYQKEVDTVVNQSPNIKISESEVITNSINQLVVVQYGKKNGCSASQEEIDQQLNEYENSYPTIYDSALDLFGEDGLRKGIEYRIIYEKTKEYVFDLFWSEHTSVDEQSVIDFCSQKGVNYSDLSNNDRELATDAYTNFLQQDYFLEFQESLVDSAEIIY